MNVDLRRRAGVNCIYDCRTCLPSADGSARIVFVEHLVEHLDYTEEVADFLRE